MKIEFKETLEKEMVVGMNLFLGAGFSVYAKDSSKRKLPIASDLAHELASHFNCPDLNDLTRICTIIDSFNSEGLKKYLIDRFDVVEYDSFYKNILKINFQRVFTTNIDNLMSKIIDGTDSRYLNNIFKNGASYQDTNCIDYYPVHGSIEYPEDKFLFNMQEVSSSFRTKRNAWASLSNAAEQLPTLFLGYGLNDASTIEALWGNDTEVRNHKNKWILLRNEDSGIEAYFKALGFKIIIADIKTFLEYLASLKLSANIQSDKSEKDDIYTIFPKCKVPRPNTDLKVRSIDEFFLGDAPIWSDVFSNRIHSTSHLDSILNLIESNKHLIITGIPASGKSTLMLQLAVKLQKSKVRVCIFNDVSISKSNIIKSEIKSPTIILIDNFTNDIDAFINLENNPNIKLVGFDRHYNVDISGHKLSKAKHTFYDISDLSPQDIQAIFNTIPLGIRKPTLTHRESSVEIPSIFEVINYNITRPSLKDRYIPILEQLEDRNEIMLDLLVMACYLHSCRIPVSFEVANSYLWEQTESYDEVWELMSLLKGMINEAVGEVIDEDQDYYQPRSQILSETIIDQTKSSVFRRVYQQFHKNVPKHQIPKFNIFKRSAYDAFYTTKAFNNWEDGLKFYDEIFKYDKTPFILQQCALFLLKKKRYTEAALKIDKALQVSKIRIFSIENTHAIILFKANIYAARHDQKARQILDQSMQILMKCYQDDQRKVYHAITYAEQALEYVALSNDSKAKSYLELALKWLYEVQSERQNNYRIRSLINEIKKLH